MVYQWTMVCGIGNDCKLITSVACAGNLAAINDFSTQCKPGGLFFFFCVAAALGRTTREMKAAPF
jgi:hypothetical protein